MVTSFSLKISSLHCAKISSFSDLAFPHLGHNVKSKVCCMKLKIMVSNLFYSENDQFDG